MSTTTRPSQSGSARPILLLLLVVVSFAAGALTSWWWRTQLGPKTAAVATPPPNFGPLTPSPLAASPEAEPSAAPSPEAARPAVAEAVPAPPSSTLPARRTGARAARGATNPAAPPAPPVAPPAGKAATAPTGAVRGFVLGTTVTESLRTVGRDLSGFETAGVGVKRAPKVEATIELVVEPAEVKPGEPYSVKVFLRNQGRKPIDVGEMKVSMIVDGKSSTRPLPPKARQVAPQERALLEELPGVWREDVSDWAVEAVVTSKVQDVYRNRLTWK